MAFTVYIPENNKPVVVAALDRCNNQRVLSGTNPELDIAKGIFWLESVIASSGTLTITDWNGHTIAASVSSWSSENSPLRCDYGIKITGEVAIAKGFLQPGVFTE